MPSPPTSINVGGILCKVYNKAEALDTGLPIGVLIAAHGRGEDQDAMKALVEGVVETCERESKGGKARRALMVVTFDQRNHGTRVVDANANEAFKRNPTHAIDMYAIQRGTARDISLLIDFLPMYLFPEDERKVEEFFVTGVSLGGHATWIALKEDPRIRIGIPIIGCPDYQTLISNRLNDFKNSTPSTKAVFPTALLDLLAIADPINTHYSSSSSLNPFLNKNILVLTGAEDPLVPAKYTKTFFDGLNVGQGVKEWVDEEGKGHEVTKQMIRKTGEWIWKFGLSADGPEKLPKAVL